MIKNFLRILVCPLDWGIGHATRCVPVIRHFRDSGHEVVIAADGRPLEFLKSHFPDLEAIKFPGYTISYPSGKNMVLKMAVQSLSILMHIRQEHRRLDKLLKERHFDVVISDNRFGLWTTKAHSVYMTHQVMIKAPQKLKWTEPWLYKFHRWFINKYDELWVPDVPGNPNLSGDLSHKYPLPENGYFIGTMSRFKSPNHQILQSPNPPIPQSPNPPILFSLSGPEPQRTILEQKIIHQLEKNPEVQAIILRGLPGDDSEIQAGPNVSIVNHPDNNQMQELILNAKMIVCRPGYSTLMDLAALGRGAILVPTPGQTEQEYLAQHLAETGSFIAVDQDVLTLEDILNVSDKLLPFNAFADDGSLLRARIRSLLEKISPQS